MVSGVEARVWAVGEDLGAWAHGLAQLAQVGHHPEGAGGGGRLAALHAGLQLVGRVVRGRTLAERSVHRAELHDLLQQPSLAVAGARGGVRLLLVHVGHRLARVLLHRAAARQCGLRDHLQLVFGALLRRLLPALVRVRHGRLPVAAAHVLAPPGFVPAQGGRGVDLAVGEQPLAGARVEVHVQLAHQQAHILLRALGRVHQVTAGVIGAAQDA
mmetsp:Transcript_78326/g.243952  ORF Transcript_78326/g.243952 Transcript_78326/m.243952 type:complete len:214 (-) Transcript_78326:225-866(-)